MAYLNIPFYADYNDITYDRLRSYDDFLFFVIKINEPQIYPPTYRGVSVRWRLDFHFHWKIKNNRHNFVIFWNNAIMRYIRAINKALFVGCSLRK